LKKDPNSSSWIWFGMRMPFVAAHTAETASESSRYQRMYRESGFFAS